VNLVNNVPFYKSVPSALPRSGLPDGSAPTTPTTVISIKKKYPFRLASRRLDDPNTVVIYLEHH
jgi:hypothetical protein